VCCRGGGGCGRGLAGSESVWKGLSCSIPRRERATNEIERKKKPAVGLKVGGSREQSGVVGGASWPVVE